MLEHGVSEYSENIISDGYRIHRAVDPLLQVIEGSEIEYMSYVTPAIHTLVKAARAMTKRGEGVSIGPSQGKVDLTQVVLDTDTGATLEDICVSSYPEYKDEPLVAVLRYLQRVGAVYCEIPSVKYSDEGQVPSYTKVLTTSNMDVVREWDEGCTIKSTAEAKLADADAAIVDSKEFPQLKLDVKRQGGVRTVINAQKKFDPTVKGLSTMPLIVQAGIVDVLYKAAKRDYIRVTFTKDAGEERSITTTLNPDLIHEVYGEDYDVDGLLEGCYDGDFLSSPNLARGYIRVPAIGESRYGELGRSINYNRIIKVEYGVEPDTSYVNIDSESVVPSFFAALNDLDVADLTDMGIALKDFGLSKYVVPGDPEQMETWLRRSMMFSGSVFRNELAMFMLANSATWFPKYDGSRSAEIAVDTDSMGLVAD